MDDTSALSHEDTDVLPQSYYCYRLHSWASGRHTVLGPECTETPPSRPPEGLFHAGLTETTLTIAWRDQALTTAYTIDFEGLPHTGWFFSTHTDRTPTCRVYTANYGINPPGYPQQCFVLYAYNELSDARVPIDSECFSLSNPPPSAPHIIPVRNTGETIELEYQDHSKVEEWNEVDRCAIDESACITITRWGGDARRFVTVEDSGLVPGTWYLYRARAWNASGQASVDTWTYTLGAAPSPVMKRRVPVPVSEYQGTRRYGTSFGHGSSGIVRSISLPEQDLDLGDYGIRLLVSPPYDCANEASGVVMKEGDMLTGDVLPGVTATSDASLPILIRMCLDGGDATKLVPAIALDVEFVLSS
jgi:hypothetical protein